MCENSISEKERDRQLELYKLEYEQAAQRYENIYRAIWQNFSYMAVLAAGILTFGSRNLNFPPELTAFIALSPLVFWFLATYVPMDFYGDRTREYLGMIEKHLNTELSLKKNLQHYQNFQSSKPLWRVKDAVRFSGTLVCFIWVIFMLLTLRYYVVQLPEISAGRILLKTKPVKVQAEDSKIQEIETTGETLFQEIDSINKSFWEFE